MSHAIEVRKIPFDFAPGVPSVWHPEQQEWSHMVNGASLAMPYLEPFLNRTMREAMTRIIDPDLREDISGFIRQEAQHYANHRRYNEKLKANGYPELAAVEATFDADYAALEKASLERRLAYCAGFETMTMGITQWLIDERDQLFNGADPTVTSLVLWHMVEETEHKSVAYDVFQAVSGRYWLRVTGLLHGSLHVGLMSRRAYMVMLKKDGLWRNFRSRLRLWRMVARFFHKAGWAMLQALWPGYHPDKVNDPAWIAQWRHAYARHGVDFVPLLKTSGSSVCPEF